MNPPSVSGVATLATAVTSAPAPVIQAAVSQPQVSVSQPAVTSAQAMRIRLMPGDLSNIASAVAGILQPALPGPSRNPLAVGPPNVPRLTSPRLLPRLQVIAMCLHCCSAYLATCVPLAKVQRTSSPLPVPRAGCGATGVQHTLYAVFSVHWARYRLYSIISAVHCCCYLTEVLLSLLLSQVAAAQHCHYQWTLNWH